MTVIAAVARGGTIVIGADVGNVYGGIAVYGAEKVITLPVKTDPPQHPTPKVILAAAGNGGMLGILARHLKIEGVPDRDNPDDVQRWADAIATAVSEILAGATPPMLVEEEGGTKIDGTLLLGWGGHLFYLFTNQAARVSDGIAAMGTGSEIALGAMHMGMTWGRLTTHEVVEHAVRISCRYAPWCRLDEEGPRVWTLP